MKNNILYNLVSFASKVFGVKEVFAHCDIPCGIYTAEPIQTAAKTVMRMVELIEQTKIGTERDCSITSQNAMTRYVLVKEQHAQLCKDQLLILWADYFKEGHLSMFPDLHDKFWNAIKLCSKNKHQVNMELARQLYNAVSEIAQMFAKAESAKFKV